jgi:hypothetical protein
VMARPDEASPIGNKTASVAAVPRGDSGPSPNRPAARGAQLQQRKSFIPNRSTMRPESEPSRSNLNC